MRPMQILILKCPICRYKDLKKLIKEIIDAPYAVYVPTKVLAEAGGSRGSGMAH
jgi:hypothetical protein